MTTKSSNFEINLLPIISLLAVLISFLLLSTTWVYTSSIDIKQAIGDRNTPLKDKSQMLSLWIRAGKNQSLVFNIKKGDKTLKQANYAKGIGPGSHLYSFTKKIVGQYPELAQAFVQPHLNTSYQDVIHIIDNLKKLNVNDVGVVPLAVR